ncbi:MAG: carboxypeptidase regulatory-like domain-containing protein, partial [Oligoflexales bacterium]|nr:carboxypeptidase regulatory-like domain-containing protein [Oligoflexales bacterium]
ISIALYLLAGCSKNAEKSEGSGDGSQRPETAVVQGSLIVPSGSTSEKMGDKKVTLMDESGNNLGEGTTTPNGTFAIQIGSGAAKFRLAEGTKTQIPPFVYIKSLFLDSTASSKTALGVKDSFMIDSTKQTMENGTPTFKSGDHTIAKVGAIYGKITLETNESPIGIDIYVPGTTHIAKTDGNGTFLLGFLPRGNHTIRADKDGYGSLEWSNVLVKNQQTTDIGEAKMRISSGPRVASFTLSDGTNIALSASIKLKIELRGATRYRVSELSDFRDASYQPVDVNAASMTVPFTIGGSDGTKTIYLEATDSNGLSASSSLEVIFDTKVPTAPTFYIKSSGAQNGYSNTTSPSLFVSSCDDITYLLLTENADTKPASADITLSCPLALTTGVPVTISSQDGTKNVYLWVKDRAGQVSAAANAGTVKLDTVAPTLTVTPDARAYNETISVSATAGTEVNVYYTFDLTTPTALSPMVPSTGKLVLASAATIKLIAIDYAGNSSSVVERTYSIDRDAPILASITLTSGSSLTNSTSVPLTLSCQSATYMALAETASDLASSSSWVAYSASYTHTLSNTTEGTKTIYVKFRDDAYNIIGGNGDYSVSFTLDTTAPASGYITLQNPESPTGAFNAPLAWTHTYENESNMTFYVEVFDSAGYASGEYSGTALRQLSTTANSIMISPPLDTAGTYYWRVQPADAAGNRASFWVTSGDAKKIQIKQFATAYMSKKDLYGDSSKDQYFARSMVSLGNNVIAYSILDTDYAGLSQSCYNCGAVKIYNYSTNTLLATLTEYLNKENGYGHKLITCDLVDGGNPELVVTAPGYVATKDGIQYRRAGAIFVYDTST